MKDLRGKPVLVTGAASGIGRAAAVEFARVGADPLLLNDINEPGLEETTSEVERLGSRALVLVADVADQAAVQDMVGRALRLSGYVEVLANVAGTGMVCPLEELRREDWERVMEVNLWGVINTTGAVYPHMMARGSGHVVNVSSVSGLWGDMVFIAPYVTSKFGVVGLSHALLVEGAPHSIGVTCVCPGIVNTPIWESGEIRGFDEGFASRARKLAALGEPPEKTARSIVDAVRRNRFLVVTTANYRFEYFLRRHFHPLMVRFDRTWPRLVCRIAARYRG